MIPEGQTESPSLAACSLEQRTMMAQRAPLSPAVTAAMAAPAAPAKELCDDIFFVAAEGKA